MANHYTSQNPAPRLPPEVLIQVFKHLQPEWILYTLPLDLLAVSLVCREWQAVTESLFGRMFDNLFARCRYDIHEFEKLLRFFRISRECGLDYCHRITRITICTSQFSKQKKSGGWTHNQKAENLFVHLFSICPNLQRVEIDAIDVYHKRRFKDLQRFYTRILPFCTKVTDFVLENDIDHPEKVYTHLFLAGLANTLHSIRLYEAKHTTAILRTLSSCRHIRSFESRYCDDRLATAIPSWPNLRTFRVAQSPSLSFSSKNLDSVIVQLATSCPRLTNLELSAGAAGCRSRPVVRNHLPSNAALCLLAFRCRRLKTVRLHQNPKLTDAFLRVLALTAPRLRVLELEECQALTGEDVVPAWPCLTSLGLRGCYGVGMAFVEKLIAACPKLREITAPFEPYSEAFQAMTERLRKLGFVAVDKRQLEWRRKIDDDVEEQEEEEMIEVGGDGGEAVDDGLVLGWLRKIKEEAGTNLNNISEWEEDEDRNGMESEEEEEEEEIDEESDHPEDFLF
ncbi:hypothetical protein BC936DRAFT_143840 [Jimgerdemannia flammicorona]|uniref:Uncharacterized protein n=2 Tax=Jimgerdemannia flammicorona TaxID=994334 RepID=A0A433QMF5_9FUNG|nr:hypothetical protein BC936DRAFT_143840 [Jimgerdemannia flammicorona]RUS30962.1 hypothetical protein BC938DRAFT_478704 [Jimgerdemannia flammicorona]